MERKHIQVLELFKVWASDIILNALLTNITLKVQSKNVDDYVEIYAQGEDKELEQFIQSVIKGASPASSVTDYNIKNLDIDDSLTEFKTI